VEKLNSVFHVGLQVC